MATVTSVYSFIVILQTVWAHSDAASLSVPIIVAARVEKGYFDSSNTMLLLKHQLGYSFVFLPFVTLTWFKNIQRKSNPDRRKCYEFLQQVVQV